MPTRPIRKDTEELLNALTELFEGMRRIDEDPASAWRTKHGDWHESARNFLHYLVLRRRDLREIQDRLADLGLSSLGRCESHVLANVERVMESLHQRLRRPWKIGARGAVCDRERGRHWLARHTQNLLGPPRPHRLTRIMVTLPTEAGEDPGVASSLVAAGMDVARINCAHDNSQVWERMVEYVRRASHDVGRPCRILMDLGGPKLRTGTIAGGPQVIKVRVKRDVFGRVTLPARVWLTGAESPAVPPAAVAATLEVEGDLLAQVEPEDVFEFEDSRGAARRLTVSGRAPGGCYADLEKTAYVGEGTVLRAASDAERTARIVNVPPIEQKILLSRGESLMLTADQTPGEPAKLDASGRMLVPARIPCTLPEIFADVRPGERIWIDDGRIGGVVRSVSKDALHVQLTQVREGGDRVRADKGINLPDSLLHVRSLTAKDHADLPFIAAHADMVGASFVKDTRDIEELEGALAALNRSDLGLVLKIETRQAFENLPGLALMAMHNPCVGVMIARGDLAVECGFERLAEVQEEILWICEAAHVPVIWATQVLESLAKEGRPSRAEITDAAMSHRAECVMLNKGPHVAHAVRVLDDILHRMEAHQHKKSARLRELSLARNATSLGQAEA